METKTRILYRKTIVISTMVSALGILVFYLGSLSRASAAPENLHSDISIMSSVSSERWRIFADMNKERGDPGVVAYKDKIYVMGGYFPRFYGYNQTQEVYDPQTDSWQFRANLPIGRSDMMVASYGDKLYAIGGWNLDLGGTYTYTNEYDPVANIWITRTSMITPVSGAGVVVVTKTLIATDTIYILGGFTHSKQSGAVQKYDPISDTWSLGSPMSVPRSELGAVLLNGKIYAIGGVTANGITTNTVEIYFPITDTWKVGPSLPEVRASMGVGVRQGKIYVVGGTDDWATSNPNGNPTNTAFVFDPDTNSWSTTVNPMPTSRTACRAAVVKGIIYVIGGKGDPGVGSANEGYPFPPITSTTTISDNPDPSQINQPFTVSYTVTATGEIPTGVVTVTVDNRPESCNGPLTGGVGSCQLALDTLGTYTLTATYGGNYILLGSSDTVTHAVVKADTNSTITADDPDPSVIGQPISVTFTVTSPFGMPGGSVLVTASNSLESCSGDLTNGSGNCNLTFNATGTYTLTTTYGGDSNFNPSSDTQSHTVTKINTRTKITAGNPDPSFVNQPISITYTVTSNLGIPTGPVTVTVSKTSLVCSSMLVNGNGNCPLAIPTPGTYTLTAEYNGDETFNPSSDSEPHVVEPKKVFLPLALR